MRALGFLFFLAVLGGVAWLVLSNGALQGLGTEAPTSELAVAEQAAGDLRDLEAIVEDALDNARRASDLAEELDAAANEARSAASDLAGLAGDNDAARPSAEAAVIAAEDAQEAALVMRRYAEALKARFLDADAAAEEAKAIAGMAVAVEETQAEAERAAAAARAARAEMARTEEVAGELDPAPGADALDGEIVVIEDDAPAAGEDVQRRLDEIFPGEILDYEEDDAPFGERG